MRRLLVLLGGLLALTGVHAQPPATLPARKVLFLGDNGHHKPQERFRQLAPVLAARGIDLTYTDSVKSLNPETLAKYDGLVVYANHTQWSPEQEKALLDYVEGGKGFVPLHCASACWNGSAKYVALVGAKFASHKTGTFSVKQVGKHPVTDGLEPFTSYDETYVHADHNTKDRTVLEERVEKGKAEPWTWVRTQGKGRVFYTAWGHDERTWGNPGFQTLVERGIRWSVGDDPTKVTPPPSDKPKMTGPSPDAPKPEYVDAKVPFYAPGGRGSGEPLTKMQMPMTVEQSVPHMQFPADLEPRLFVAEPQLGGKPMAMAWDERGRLWVSVTVDYPNELRAQGKGNDRIVICEDADNDGTADKFTVFAEGLSIPTSLCFARGGVIVHAAPNTFFLKDTDGDGKADVRDVLFRGWGTGDTHAGPSNLRNGLDGWIYGIVGYSGFRGRVGNTDHRFGQGIYRFKPDGSALEFLRSTSNNSWGLGFSEEGHLFGSTANGCSNVYLPIPNRYFEAVRGWSAGVLPNIATSNRFHPISDKIRQVDWHGGFTSAAGHSLYTARTYDRAYWNKTAFVSDPTGHLTATFQLQPVGTDFVARYGWNLLASTDEWTAPIVAEVGPDGQVWLIDWYAFIVQHNPTPRGFTTGAGNAYETPLRDKKHGRIYRLVKKDGKPAETPKLDTPEAMVAALRNDNMLWRMHAQRLLVERGKPDVLDALVKEVANVKVDDVGLTPGAIHALWALHGLGLIEKNEAALAAVKAALTHPSAGVRRNAFLVLPRNQAGADLLQVRFNDKEADPQVLLARLLALAEMPAQDKVGAQLKALAMDADLLGDKHLPDALTAAAARHDAGFLRAIVAEGKQLEPRTLRIVGLVAEHYGRGGPVETVGALLADLEKTHPATRLALLTAIEKGWPRSAKAKLTDEQEKAVVALMVKLPTEGQGRMVRLLSAWGSQAVAKFGAEVAKTLFATAEDAKADEEARLTAARQLVELVGDQAETRTRLLELVGTRAAPKLAEGVLEVLGTVADDKLAETILERYAAWTPALRAAALRALLGRTATAKVVLAALDKGTVQIGELSLDQQQALNNHPDKDVQAQAKKLLARGGALPSPDRAKVIEERLALLKKDGDATRGKEVYTKHCGACHRHGSEGGTVGPDLTGFAVHPKEEILIHLLDPNRSVEGNFRVFTAEMRDGRVLAGLVASETRTTLEIVDANAKRFTLQRADIEELTGSNRSLMPEGFEKQIGDDGLVDLMTFLTKKGKYLPLPLEKAATIVSTVGMFNDPASTVERFVFSDWKPKSVGEIPFVLIDPQGDRVKNVVLLHSTQGRIPPTMPKSVKVPCNTEAKAIHLLGGVAGWASPYGEKGTLSMIVRLHYADGSTEDHQLKNGEHIADYIRRVDVPDSKFAFAARGQQVRWLTVTPKKKETIKEVELVKGTDSTAPVVLALTVETGSSE